MAWHKHFDDLDVCMECKREVHDRCKQANCNCGCVRSARWLHAYRENILAPARRSGGL